MDRPSWILIERICSECPQRDSCTIEDLSTQKCEYLDAQLPESLKNFLARKRQVMQQLRKK